MLPWGHLAVGYLAFTLLADRRYRRPQTAGTLVALAVGTQLPDVVDKPLAWYLHVLPNGRSLGHSVFVAVLLAGVATIIARRVERPLLGVGFGCGYLAHLASDALYPLLDGELAELAFLLWPITSFPYEDGGYTVLEVLIQGTFTLAGAFEAALLVVAVVVWTRHDTPG